MPDPDQNLNRKILLQDLDAGEIPGEHREFRLAVREAVRAGSVTHVTDADGTVIADIVPARPAAARETGAVQLLATLPDEFLPDRSQPGVLRHHRWPGPPHPRDPRFWYGAVLRWFTSDDPDRRRQWIRETIDAAVQLTRVSVWTNARVLDGREDWTTTDTASLLTQAVEVAETRAGLRDLNEAWMSTTLLVLVLDDAGGAVTVRNAELFGRLLTLAPQAGVAIAITSGTQQSAVWQEAAAAIMRWSRSRPDAMTPDGGDL